MCAIDALGMAEMLNASVLIRSADPSNGAPVTVTLDGRSAVWHPATTVVFVGRTAAEAWASAHPEITGGILSQASHQGGEACVCDLNDAFDLSQPTISHHLKVLHEAGLVDRDKRGVWVYCRARPQALAAVGALIGCSPPGSR